MDDEVVVLDNGTGVCKIGYAGEETPRACFPTVVSRETGQQTFVGTEALAKREMLALHRPMEQGRVTDWAGMEAVWQHAFHDQLGTAAETHPVLLSEVVGTEASDREAMTEMMFEAFGIASLHIANQAVLSLYASGRTTGLVLDAGEGLSHTMAIYEGFAIPASVRRTPLAGAAVTARLAELLALRGCPLTSSAGMETVREMKEAMAFVARDAAAAAAAPASLARPQETYLLPDGQQVTVDAERFLCSEVLFTPTSPSSLPNMVSDALAACEVDLRRSLAQSIVLAGGTTCLPGFATRLHSALATLLPCADSIAVVAEPTRSVQTWLGGSILGSLSNYNAIFLSAAAYNEHGPSAIHTKCR